MRLRVYPTCLADCELQGVIEAFKFRHERIVTPNPSFQILERRLNRVKIGCRNSRITPECSQSSRRRPDLWIFALSNTMIDRGPGYGVVFGKTWCSTKSSKSSALIAPWYIM